MLGYDSGRTPVVAQGFYSAPIDPSDLQSPLLSSGLNVLDVSRGFPSVAGSNAVATPSFPTSAFAQSTTTVQVGRGAPQLLDTSSFPAVITGVAGFGFGGGGGGGPVFLGDVIAVPTGDRIVIGRELNPLTDGPLTLGNTDLKALVDFVEEVWSYFKFYAIFTADGVPWPKSVDITSAFSDTDGSADGYKHASAGFSQAALQACLNAAFNIKPPPDAFWNDLEDITIVPDQNIIPSITSPKVKEAVHKVTSKAGKKGNPGGVIRLSVTFKIDGKTRAPNQPVPPGYKKK